MKYPAEAYRLIDKTRFTGIAVIDDQFFVDVEDKDHLDAPAFLRHVLRQLNEDQYELRKKKPPEGAHVVETYLDEEGIIRARLTCLSDSSHACHFYPSCDCEYWGEGHSDRHPFEVQETCWTDSWFSSGR